MPEAQNNISLVSFNDTSIVTIEGLGHEGERISERMMEPKSSEVKGVIDPSLEKSTREPKYPEANPNMVVITDTSSESNPDEQASDLTLMTESVTTSHLPLGSQNLMQDEDSKGSSGMRILNVDIRNAKTDELDLINPPLEDEFDKYLEETALNYEEANSDSAVKNEDFVIHEVVSSDPNLSDNIKDVTETLILEEKELPEESTVKNIILDSPSGNSLNNSSLYTEITQSQASKITEESSGDFEEMITTLEKDSNLITILEMTSESNQIVGNGHDDNEIPSENEADFDLSVTEEQRDNALSSNAKEAINVYESPIDSPEDTKESKVKGVSDNTDSAKPSTTSSTLDINTAIISDKSTPGNEQGVPTLNSEKRHISEAPIGGLNIGLLFPV